MVDTAAMILSTATLVVLSDAEEGPMEQGTNDPSAV